MSRDIMHGHAELPLAHRRSPMSEALIVMTSRSYGCLGVIDDEWTAHGIVTDGDLRRPMNGLPRPPVAEVMTLNPKTSIRFSLRRPSNFSIRRRSPACSCRCRTSASGPRPHPRPAAYRRANFILPIFGGGGA